MNKKTLLGGISAFIISALFIGYPAIEKFNPEDQKPAGSSPSEKIKDKEIVAEKFSNNENALSKEKDTAIAKNSLTGMSENELYQLKLKDSAEYFREAYRKKILQDGGEIKMYRSKEEQRTALQEKLAKKITTHLKNNISNKVN